MADEETPQVPLERRMAGAKTISSSQTPGPKGTNPFTHEGSGATGGTGGVDPSDPTIGTEGWGLGKNEANTTEGQLDRAQRDEQTLGNRTFRCADAGNADCRWETSAGSDDELMAAIERHGREAHGLDKIDEATRRKFRNAIRERRAA